MVWFWVGAIIGFTALELSTLKMFFGSFALGSASVALAVIILPSLAIRWQILLFLAVCASVIFIGRPLLKFAVNKIKQKNKHE